MRTPNETNQGPDTQTDAGIGFVRRLAHELWRVLVVGGVLAAVVAVILTFLLTQKPGTTGGAIPPGAVTATITCSNSCTTNNRDVRVQGTIDGVLPDHHELVMFTTDQGGTFYLGSHVAPVGSTWAGAVKVGNSSTTGTPTLTYSACLYDIDSTFSADLDARGSDELNNGLARIPTVGTAEQLACVTVTWNRPGS
jgi:hypothetical protein